MKKKPFLLLEILLALAIVVLCIVPLVVQPLKLYRLEMKNLEKLEKERMANSTFAEIKEMLLKNEISWGNIPSKNTSTGPFSLPKGTLEMAGRVKSVERSFTLSGIGEKKGKNQELFRSILVMISLDKTDYEFILPIQRLSVEQTF